MRSEIYNIQQFKTMPPTAVLLLFFLFNDTLSGWKPVPVAVLPWAWVCGRSPVEIVGSNPNGGMDVCLSIVSVVYYLVEFSATSWSLVQKSPTE